MGRWLRQIVVGLLALVLVVVGLLLGSIAVDAVVGGRRLDALVNATIPNPNGPPVRAYVARPAGTGPLPAVIMIHEFWGLKPDIVGKAEALAQEGYVVVAPDLFRGSTTSWIPRAIFQTVTTPAEQVDGDLGAVYTWLAQQPGVKRDHIAVMGFCFGGATALRYSLKNNQLAGTVVFYGSPITDPAQLKALSGPVLGIFGGADSSIPVANVRAFESALRQAGVPNQISIYDGQPHAFVKSIEEIRQGGPPQQAWNEMLAFLKQTLQGTQASQRDATPLSAASAPDLGYWMRLALAHLEPHHH